MVPLSTDKNPFNYIQEDWFFKELEAQNSRQPPDAPAVIIFQAGSDYNATFSESKVLCNTLIATQNKFCIFKIIRTFEQFQKQIQSIQKELQDQHRSIASILFFAHGKSDHISFGSEEIDCPILLPELNQLFPYLSSNGSLIFLSCSTGKVLAPALSTIIQAQAKLPGVEKSLATKLLSLRIFACAEDSTYAHIRTDSDGRIELVTKKEAIYKNRFFPSSRPPTLRTKKQNKAMKLRLLKQAAADGFYRPRVELALRYQRGKGIRKSPRLALSWIRKAEENPHPLMAGRAFRYHAYMDPTTEDPSIEYMIKAAEKNDLLAQQFLYELYSKPPTTPENYELALQWLIAIHQNSTSFQELSSEFYTASDRWLHQMAEGGNFSAQKYLSTDCSPHFHKSALYNLDRELVHKNTRNHPDAIRWLQECARKGDFASQVYLMIWHGIYLENQDLEHQLFTIQSTQELQTKLSIIENCMLRSNAISGPGVQFIDSLSSLIHTFTPIEIICQICRIQSQKFSLLMHLRI